MRTINQVGIDLIKEFEGCILHPYKDAVGLLTIGVGHLIKKGETFPDSITQEEADNLLQKDLERFCEAIVRLVKVPLTDNQFAALVSLSFNIGEGNFKPSTLLKRINSSDMDVGTEFLKWKKAGGKVLKGLLRRREAEKALWESS